jgi:hypothetical protein
MDKHKNSSLNKKQFKNIWNWCIIILIMVLLGKIWKFLGNPFCDPQTIDVLTFYIVVLVLISGIVTWLVRRYLTNHPFTMRFSNEGPYYNGDLSLSKTKKIEGVHGLFPDTIILKIKMKKERNLEQINIRLIEKQCFFCNWKDAPKNSIFIEKITDPINEGASHNTDRKFHDADDTRGGRDGYYRPSCYCPKNDYLWYKVKLHIDPDIKQWHGYISLQHRRGDANRAYSRAKIIIKNIEL